MTRPPPASAAASAPPPLDSVSAESDFVIILAALLCALICVVGLIAVIRCTWLRRTPAGPGDGPRSPCSAAANKGVKKKVLQSLPKFTYSASSSSPSAAAGPASKFAAECSICLTEFLEGDEVRVLPQCGHGFHVACIDTWLVSRSSCPSCRQVLVVGRCQKCGGFPVAHGGGSGTSEAGPAEVELKEREDAQLGNRNNGEGLLP